MLILKFIIGGFIVILIDLISKSSKYYFISGLVPLFPTFALIAHFFVYKYNGIEALKKTALFGLFSLLPYGCYLLSVFLLSKRVGFILTIIISLIIWFILAYIIYYYFNK